MGVADGCGVAPVMIPTPGSSACCWASHVSNYSYTVTWQQVAILPVVKYRSCLVCLWPFISFGNLQHDRTGIALWSLSPTSHDQRAQISLASQ